MPEHSLQNRIFVPTDECRIAQPGEWLIAPQLSSDWAIAIQHAPSGLGAMLRFSANIETESPAMAQANSLERAILHAVGTLRAAMPQDATPAGQRAAAAGWIAHVIGGASAEGTTSGMEARRQKSLRLAVLHLLWREGILLQGEDLGGDRIRSVHFIPSAGRVIVRSGAVSTPSLAAQEGVSCPLAS
jgi:chemotaxis receptor (MCP) glutamine deamidase CheD